MLLIYHSLAFWGGKGGAIRGVHVVEHIGARSRAGAGTHAGSVLKISVLVLGRPTRVILASFSMLSQPLLSMALCRHIKMSTKMARVETQVKTQVKHRKGLKRS